MKNVYRHYKQLRNNQRIILRLQFVQFGFMNNLAPQLAHKIKSLHAICRLVVLRLMLVKYAK